MCKDPTVASRHSLAGARSLWVVIGQANQLTNIDVEVIAHGELVGVGDVHIAEAVLGQLHKLGCAGRGDQQLALTKLA